MPTKRMVGVMTQAVTLSSSKKGKEDDLNTQELEEIVP